MKTMLMAAAMMIVAVVVYARNEAESAGTAPGAQFAQAPNAVIDPPRDVAVGDRYVVPALPPSVVDQLPATEAAGDQYLAERIALADLVIGDRILAAEDLATAYTRELPGFGEVLLADGFRQEADGAWYYDRYASWMRFPLNR